jgi:hypothetical protein
MAAPVTLQSIYNQCFLLADAENDNGFFQQAEVVQYINNSYAKLYDLLTSFPDSDYNLRWYYFRTTQLNQSFGVGTNAGATTFTGTLLGTTISHGSVQLYTTLGLAGVDNGSGTISGNGLTGTINYTTGAISVTFTIPPMWGSNISATYVGSVSTVNTYSLPLNHYKPRGLDLQISQANQGTQWVSIRNFMFMERNQYNYLYNPIAISILGGTNLLYRVLDQYLELIPTPNIANLNFRLGYIPTYPALVSMTDTFDGVNGWEEFILFDVVIKMLTKQEADASVWIGEKAETVKRIEAMASARDVGNPQRVSDTVQGQSNGPFMIGGLPL